MLSKNLMANYLKRSSKDHKQHPNQNQGCCRRHPKHRQSPGVCSLCLVEKLSRLSADSNSRCIAASSSCCSSSSSNLSSYYSSSSASSYSSPMHRYAQGKGYSFCKNILTKSRSVAFANSKKKTGLLSKLLHPTNGTKRKELEAKAGLEHSRTMREILTSKVR